MTGKIIIDSERCKGCSLCVTACPKNCIVISNRPNTIGYFPAEASPVRSKTPALLKSQRKKSLTGPTEETSNGASNIGCTGCAMCAIICPDAAIVVFADSDTAAEPSKKNKPTLIKEKA